jgi:hypothetical protein
MKKINAVIFIHGMTTEFKPPEPIAKFYKPMWESLVSKIPGFKSPQWQPIFVKWGNVFPGDSRPFRQDQKLSLAEQRTTLLASKNINPMPGSGRWDFGWPILRQHLEPLRFRVLRGLSDAMYYCSHDGERHVRKAVYGQVLERLSPLLRAGLSVRLHVIAHSLGNVVAHDFLYGIFNTRKRPDFACDKVSNKAHRRTYLDLRKLAKGPQPRVTFGSFSSMASPMPFFVVRKQKIVNLLAEGKGLDAAQIGIDIGRDDLQWKIFYDKDDILGFPTRNLYENAGGAIGDYHVSTGWLPLAAHMNYWKNKDVLRETAELLGRRRL